MKTKDHEYHQDKRDTLLVILTVFSIVNFVSMIVMAETFIFANKRFSKIEYNNEKIMRTLYTEETPPK